MFRWIGILLSGAIVVSIALPWVVGPTTGEVTLLDMTKNFDLSRIDMRFVKEALSHPINSNPASAAPWAIAAFAVSFPLAGLFALFGLLGYFSKPMAVLLGVLPLGAAAFTFYLRTRLNSTFATVGNNDALTTFVNGLSRQGITYGIGLPLYLCAAVLLLLSAFFVSNSRRRN